MSPCNSWSSNRVNLEPLTLTESIGELETALALYDQLTETESTDG
ncbi:hypothetical protein [Saliphagus sp. LR7]|nr:hypothetical protein [Saliphagus sp. LR7]